MRITLNSGRTIALARLQQSLTYLGVLAGRPHLETDLVHVQEALDEAQGLIHADARPFLIRSEGTPLPRVSCVGIFDSGPLAKTDSEPYSSLAVVWFQDDFAATIPEAVAEQIRALDWESLAKDWIW